MSPEGLEPHRGDCDLHGREHEGKVQRANATAPHADGELQPSWAAMDPFQLV